jgi:transposase
MYIRQISRRLADGSRVRYLQLAQKIRDPKTGIPRDEVLHHFGRADQIDQDQIQRLIESLSRFLDAGEQARVQARLGGVGDELEVERSLAYGGTYLLDQLWRRLELDQALGKLLSERSFGHDIERVLFALVSNRALDPRSKLAVERWVGRHAAIDGLDEVPVQALYRAMDFLVEHGEEIQKTVFFSASSLLNLEVDLLFFDTTSTYFEIEEADEDGEGPRRYGKSKDHRPDRPQVVIGLAVTRGGLPVRCWVLPGNRNDASLVERVQRDLAGWKLSRVVWVVDRGMAGENQRLALQRGGGQVIVGEKLRGGSKQAQEALSRAGRYQRVRENLEVKEITLRNGSETRRFVLVRNPKHAERVRAERERLLERLVAEIEALNTRRGSKAQHSRRVCELKTHPSLRPYVRELKSGELRVDRARVRAEERLDGKYLLSTTDPSLSAEDVALGYKQLAEVERSFRTLKSTLDLRPLYHRLPERIEAHVLLCWLALLLVRLVETETEEGWELVRDELDQIHRVDLRTKDGDFQVVTKLTDRQRKLLKSLGFTPPKVASSVRLRTAAA